MKISTTALISLLSLTSLAFAQGSATKNETIFYQNNTPYTVHLRVSLRNKTPIKLMTTTVEPGTRAEILTLPAVDDSEIVATVGDAKPVFSNTSAIHFVFGKTGGSYIDTDPASVTINNHTYYYVPAPYNPATDQALIAIG